MPNTLKYSFSLGFIKIVDPYDTKRYHLFWEISFLIKKSQLLALCSSSRRRKKRDKKVEYRAVDHVGDY